jgi:hypothetical protein
MTRTNMVHKYLCGTEFSSVVGNIVGAMHNGFCNASPYESLKRVIGKWSGEQSSLSLFPRSTLNTLPAISPCKETEMTDTVSQAVTNVETDITAAAPVVEAVGAVVAAADPTAAPVVDAATAAAEAVPPVVEAVATATPVWEAFFQHVAAFFKNL